MTERFFERPILNSPYEYPARHWELDASGQPTNTIVEKRRRAEFITPIPKPKKRKRSAEQQEIVFDEGKGLSTAEQQYDPTPIINDLRHRVDKWRAIPNPSDWRVTPETARLLQHWRHHKFSSFRPFFCQVEAVETAIWLTEVAPKIGKEGRQFLDHLEAANEQANPGISRLALKLATGAGKTTVMAMLIAWQTINAVRRPNSQRFTRGFLVITPGITIRDRLRVLQPNDPDSYYKDRELVPPDMLGDLGKAKIVITNYHAFKLRETVARIAPVTPDVGSTMISTLTASVIRSADCCRLAMHCVNRSAKLRAAVTRVRPVVPDGTAIPPAVGIHVARTAGKQTAIPIVEVINAVKIAIGRHASSTATVTSALRVVRIGPATRCAGPATPSATRRVVAIQTTPVVGTMMVGVAVVILPEEEEEATRVTASSIRGATPRAAAI